MTTEVPATTEVPVTVRMWEAVAAPGAAAALVGWALTDGVSSVSAQPGFVSAEVLQGDDPAALRVLLVTRWEGEASEVAVPPPRLVIARPQVWSFVVVVN
jgi:hypothetical protein